MGHLFKILRNFRWRRSDPEIKFVLAQPFFKMIDLQHIFQGLQHRRNGVVLQECNSWIKKKLSILQSSEQESLLYFNNDINSVFEYFVIDN